MVNDTIPDCCLDCEHLGCEATHAKCLLGQWFPTNKWSCANQWSINGSERGLLNEHEEHQMGTGGMNLRSIRYYGD